MPECPTVRQTARDNWDAFEECISDPDIDLPAVVHVRGMAALVRVLPRDAGLFRECASGPDAIPSFEWLA